MKIYLVREHSGEWDGYYCCNLKAFFSKEKAENYKQELEQKEEKLQQEYNTCCNCPMYSWEKEFKTFYELKEYLKNYCGKFEYISGDDEQTKDNQKYIESKNWDCIDCINEVKWYESTWYTIKEIEVEE